MTDVASLMRQVIIALPETNRRGNPTVREVSLGYNGSEWQVMAGGHSAVAMGEYGGDFNCWGTTAEDALNICLRHIAKAQP